MKALYVTVSMFKRKMEKKLRKSKGGEMPCIFFVLGFGDFFRVTLDRLMNLNFELYGRRGSGGPPPGDILVEYV